MTAVGADRARRKVYVGVFGVFLGVAVVNLSTRMLNVGLADLRGASGLGVDEAAWIPTACNMGLMFMGAFSVYLGALYGPRRVLLLAGAIFTAVSVLLPYGRRLEVLLALQVIAGLSAGTFFPLALSYALRNLPPRYTIYGIGAYAMDLIASLSIATGLQGWFFDNWSWRWMFWLSAVLTPVMMLCVFIAIPPPTTARPRVCWRGFLYAGLGMSLIYGALEQGERLDWLNSGLIIGMLTAGVGVLLYALLRRRWTAGPLVDLSFLGRQNTITLALGLCLLRFLVLGAVLLIPAYLGTVQAYRPTDTGAALLRLIVPELLAGIAAARLMKRLDGRLIAGVGFAAVAVACFFDSQLTSVWNGESFWRPQILLACGLAWAFVGMIGMLNQQAQSTCAGLRPANVLTYLAFFQVVRLLGGQLSVATLQRFVTLREQFHSNMLGLNIRAGDWVTDERVNTLVAGMSSTAAGPEDAQQMAGVLLGQQVTRQAFTLAYIDGFVFVACTAAVFLLAMALMKPMKIYFDATSMDPPS